MHLFSLARLVGVFGLLAVSIITATSEAKDNVLNSAPGAFLPKEMLERINCRVGRRKAEGGFEIYRDAEVNTISENPVDFSFETTLPSGKKLGVMLKHVAKLHSADQFAVRIFLDRELIFKTGHVDLDIYFELKIEDGPLHLLHCFPPID